MRRTDHDDDLRSQLEGLYEKRPMALVEWLKATDEDGGVESRNGVGHGQDDGRTRGRASQGASPPHRTR